VRETVAKYVNAPKDNVFMVENASDGFNGFVKSMKWKEGDVIAMPNTSYAMVKRTIDYLVDKYKVKILSVSRSLSRSTLPYRTSNHPSLFCLKSRTLSMTIRVLLGWQSPTTSDPFRQLCFPLNKLLPSIMKREFRFLLMAHMPFARLTLTSLKLAPMVM
jgi:hypothetical protein